MSPPPLVQTCTIATLTLFYLWYLHYRGSPVGSDGKESACNTGDLGSIPGSGRSPGEGNGYPLQHSCLENPHGQRGLVGHSPWGRKELDMIVFHLLRGNSKVGINRQKKEAANLKRGCEAEEHKKWTEPKEPVECQQPDQYTHCGSSRRKKRERGRENMGRNNDWKLPKSDERQYVLTVEYCSAFQS